jgi:hypothetical protein
VTRLLRLLLFALAAAVLLPAGSALADDDEEKERERRLKETEERLKGKTPQERKEFEKKLERLRRMSDREKDELRRKHRKTRHIADRLAKDLPPDLKRKLDRLPREERESLLHHAVDRMLCILRDEMRASLTRDERRRVDALVGRDRFSAMIELKKRKLLERLGPEERAELDALPKNERDKRIRKMMRRAFEAERKKLRERAVDEVRRLLESPPAERRKLLRASRVRQELERMGYDDGELSRLLGELPGPELRRAMAELKRIRKIQDPKAREKALEALKARLAR